MRSSLGILGFLVPVFFSTGCASILSGTSQTITLNSNPPGARCELVREGRIIGTVENTPGAVTVRKTKHDIDVVCKKQGFTEAKEFAESGTDGSVFGNIILSGVVGWAVDSAAGADNKYPEVFTVNMTPIGQAVENVSRAAAPKAAAPAQKGSGAGSKQEPTKRLETLKALLDQGVLTEAEYQRKRAEVIDSL